MLLELVELEELDVLELDVDPDNAANKLAYRSDVSGLSGLNCGRVG